GRVSHKMAAPLRQIYDQMLEPKWVIAMGACSSSGGIFDTYSVLQGIDEIMPVDIYVPGCPPIPEGLIYAILRLQDVVEKGAPRPRMHRLTREEAKDAMTYRKVISDQLFSDAPLETKEVGEPK
ncbi:MAG: NADH-quinone oxidoreductase subunit NuoB, partial [Pseudobdellovibrionaceae bacterium]|nr:NADH-quinone oxidoreductase subunit NuoB [Pseudobdellovibrionaceae bacterium]